MRVGYNEIEPYCCAWLENLMSAGLIPIGKIFNRDIRDLTPDDLDGYDQFHFFAGIGVWPLALEMAGWSEPCWTGSCPCQPFSAAGKGLGFADERHLWPAWEWLIRQQRPAIVFGEQVAKAADWLALVRGDLEALDYAVGCMPIEAASVGAPHLRDRFWFVADAGRVELRDEPGWRGRACWPDTPVARDDGATRSVGNAQGFAWNAQRPAHAGGRYEVGRTQGPLGGSSSPVADAAQLRRGAGRAGRPDPSCAREQDELVTRRPETVADSEPLGRSAVARAQHRHWESESGLGRVVAGTPARLDKLRALGNCIVPQAAAAFVEAYMQTRSV